MNIGFICFCYEYKFLDSIIVLLCEGILNIKIMRLWKVDRFFEYLLFIFLI